MNRSRCYLGVDSGGSKDPCIILVPESPRGMGNFERCPLGCGALAKFFEHFVDVFLQH